MRDDELLDLIDRTPLEDLTPEQCAAVRAAAETSPEIRRACLERIGLEERLAAALGKPQVSVDDLLAGQRRAGLRARSPWLTFAVLGLVLAAIAAVVASRKPPRPADDAVAMAPPDGVEAAAADGEPAPADEPAEAEPEAGERADPVAGTPATAASAVAPAEPPWMKAFAADAPEPSAADLVKLLPARAGIARDEIETWFRPLSGRKPEYASLKTSSSLFVTRMTGEFRLVPPLREGTALRLVVFGLGNMQIVAWSGTRGAAIEAGGPREGDRFCGSVLTRPAAGKPADGRSLVSTSDGRGQRTGVGPAGVVELRYADGCLVLSRGDVRLVEVPLPAAPDEVLFKGWMGIAGMELVRAVEPPRLRPPPPPTTSWQAGSLTWEGAGGKLVARLPTGGARLVQQEGAKQPLVATWMLPPPEAGPRELVFKIEDCAAGCGIQLAGPGGAGAVVCGLVDVPGGPPDCRRRRFAAWFSGKPPPAINAQKPGLLFAPMPLWMRVKEVDQLLVIHWSGDGERWVRCWESPTWQGIGGIASVGLYAGGKAGAGITLSTVASADLPALARLVPKRLLAAADAFVPSPAAVKSFDAWRQEAEAARPAETDPAAWMAAAAIRCLAMQRTRFTPPLALLAWRHGESLGLPLDERLAVCDDVNRLTVSLHPRDAAVFNGLYGVVARDCGAAGDMPGYRAALLRMQEAACDIAGQAAYEPLVDALGIQRWMMRSLMLQGSAAELRAELERQRFYANDTDPVATAARQSEGDGPLLFHPDNGLMSTVDEVYAMLDAESWGDAHRAITRSVADAPGDAAPSLVQDPRDRRRLVTLPILVDEALRERPGFRAYMAGDPAERGRLRLSQLRVSGDARGMAVAAVEFQGTPASGDACEWLALRAVAAGDFVAARVHVRTGLEWASPETRSRLLSIAALADSMAGIPPAAAPQAGLPGVAAGEIKAVIAAARREPAGARMPPADLDAVKRLDLGPAAVALPAIDYPQSMGPPLVSSFEPFPPSPPFFTHRLDWAAATAALVSAPGRLLASNRLEVVSLDPTTGAAQWRAAAGPAPGTIASCGLVAMRPACDERHVYVRRLAQGPVPVLAALRLADGTVAWESPAGGPNGPVSDPVIVGSTLRCCEVRKGLIEMLMLVAIDPLSGTRLWDRRLCDLLPEWWARRIGSRFDPGDCQIAVEGGTLFIATAGSVICCDPEGRLRWVRRLPWLGPAGDNWWWYQCPQPPLVHGDSVIVAPPGVQAVVAIDVASGRLRWQTPLPLARRFVGLAGVGDAARLVVETGAGIVACDPRDGTLRTILPAQEAPGPGPLGLAPTRLLGAAVATADGMAIVAVQRPRPDTPQTNARDVEILWIDVASGEVRHRAPVPALTGSPPWLGPMAVAGERLWLLAAPDLQKPQPADIRRALWELAPQPAP